MYSRNGKRTGSTDKILITGAFGFLGQARVKKMAAKYPKARLLAASRYGVLPKALKKIPMTVLKGDLKSKSFWKSLPADITHIIHLAAFIDWENTEKSSKVLRENLIPVRNLCAFSKKSPFLKQIIYSSSISVYKPSTKAITENTAPAPAGAYGRAKRQAEEKIFKLGRQTACLRLSSLYGPGQYTKTVLPVMMAHAAASGKITVFGAGRRTQDFLHVTDAAGAFCLAYEKNAQGIFNIGSGKPCSMKTLAFLAAKAAGHGTKVIFDKKRHEDYPGYKINIQKARTKLRFSPKVRLIQGLKGL